MTAFVPVEFFEGEAIGAVHLEVEACMARTGNLDRFNAVVKCEIEMVRHFNRLVARDRGFRFHLRFVWLALSTCCVDQREMPRS